MAPPGCPEFAFSTIAAESIRILSAAWFIILISFMIVFFILYKYTILYLKRQ